MSDPVPRNKLTMTDVSENKVKFSSVTKKKTKKSRKGEGKKLIERKIIKSAKIRGTKEE